MPQPALGFTELPPPLPPDPGPAPDPPEPSPPVPLELVGPAPAVPLELPPAPLALDAALAASSLEQPARPSAAPSAVTSAVVLIVEIMRRWLQVKNEVPDQSSVSLILAEPLIPPIVQRQRASMSLEPLANVLVTS
jgi:hypothetical protein